MLLLPCHVKTKFYCSNSCKAAWQKANGMNVGPNNPAWQGGFGNRGAYWKRKARERDGKTCRISGCGSTKLVHAHHWIPRAAGGKDTLENLVTLCGKHHASIERDLLRMYLEARPKLGRKLLGKIAKTYNVIVEGAPK